MSKVIDEFTDLLKQMEAALIRNDVNRVNELTARQQGCMLGIVSESTTDATVKELLRDRMPIIRKQMEINEILLRQAIALTDTMMTNLYKSIASSYRTDSLFHKSFSA